MSVDLRGASFLWIPDLAQKDPLFLTPVLMGVSMFVMQKMTPSTLDPAQQRMMMLMPLMLAGMFFAAPGRAQPLLADVEPVVDPAAGRVAAAAAAQARARAARDKKGR